MTAYFEREVDDRINRKHQPTVSKYPVPVVFLRWHFFTEHRQKVPNKNNHPMQVFTDIRIRDAEIRARGLCRRVAFVNRR